MVRTRRAARWNFMALVFNTLFCVWGVRGFFYFPYPPAAIFLLGLVAALVGVEMNSRYWRVNRMFLRLLRIEHFYWKQILWLNFADENDDEK